MLNSTLNVLPLALADGPMLWICIGVGLWLLSAAMSREGQTKASRKAKAARKGTRRSTRGAACRRCGTTHPQVARFCRHCGTGL